MQSTNRMGKWLLCAGLIVWGAAARSEEPAASCCAAAGGACCAAAGNTSTNAAPLPAASGSPALPAAANALPRLVDLGAGKCIPCKLMAPILEDLKKSYAGQLDVVFIDVWKNPDEARKYGIKLIPTQVFIGTSGKELFRHEGFFAREDILKKWQELGTELKTK